MKLTKEELKSVCNVRMWVTVCVYVCISYIDSVRSCMTSMQTWIESEDQTLYPSCFTASSLEEKLLEDGYVRKLVPGFWRDPKRRKKNSMVQRKSETRHGAEVSKWRKKKKDKRKERDREDNRNKAKYTQFPFSTYMEIGYKIESFQRKRI